MTIDFNRVRALSFDCYGTLIDWETGILTALADWVAHVGAQRVLSGFGAIEPDIEHAHPTWPYRQIVAEVHVEMARELGLTSSRAAAMRFAESIGDWPPFADTVDALRRLQSRYRLYILSNVDDVSIAATLRQLGVPFDGVFTAERIGSYKPDPRNFDYLLARLADDGIQKHELVHVAQSLFHDHGPAQAAGLHTVWIDRNSGRPGAARLPDPVPHFDLRFTSLADFAAAAVTTH